MRTLAESAILRWSSKAPAPFRMRADPEDLELIWLNLLENAVQYSPPGSTVKIRVSAMAASTAEVSVSDSGPGIPRAGIAAYF